MRRISIVAAVMALGCSMAQAQQASRCDELRANTHAKIERLRAAAEIDPLPVAAIADQLPELTESLQRLRGCGASLGTAEIPLRQGDAGQGLPTSRPSPEEMMERTLRTHRPAPQPSQRGVNVTAIETVIGQLRSSLAKSSPNQDEIKAALRRL